MKYLYVVILALILMSCSNKKKANNAIKNSSIVENSLEEQSQRVLLEVYDFNSFEKFLNKKDDKTYVINFWATWCAPCVKELPYFEKIHTEYAKQNVEVILVSLDFPHLYDSKLKPFITSRKLKSKVIALDDVDMNTWIPKVSKDWSGSIPATVIYKNNNYKFYEQSFNFEELEKEVKQFLN